MCRQFSLTILGIFFVIESFATVQTPDYLVLNGDTVPIFSNPLELYLESKTDRSLVDGLGFGTNCWRGYVAYWELKKDSLFLIHITCCYSDCGMKDADLEKEFGSKKVFAAWVTGRIRIPEGKLLFYESSIYEKDVFKCFKGGKLIKSYTVSNRKAVASKRQIERDLRILYQTQDTVFNHIAKNINWVKDYSLSMFCDDNYTLYFSKWGRIRKVKNTQTYFNTDNTKLKIWQDNFSNRKCRKKIKRSLKGLDLSYVSGLGQFDINVRLYYDEDKKALELDRYEEKNMDSHRFK